MDSHQRKNTYQVAKNETTYSFTAPKSGTFTITAKGVCDPKAVMAKQYRTKLKSIYGGRSAAGRNEYKPDDILKGQTPKRHCEALIAQRGEGRFEKVSEHEDVCYLLGGNYFGTSVGAEYSYYYDVCTEIAFTGTLNDKATNIKELANLKGGERVIITARTPSSPSMSAP